MVRVRHGSDTRVMTTNRAIHRLFSLLALFLVLGAAACGGDDESPPGTAGVPASTDATYTTQAFVLPFEVTVPTWLPAEANVDEPNFVTWEPDSPADPAVRFLVPVEVYPPGGTGPSPPPADYVEYLLGQREHGATFSDVVETTVDGRPATLVTATVADRLDGSLGCPAADVPAPDCFGLQPDLLLRLAVVDAGENPLLAWLRLDGTAGDDATSHIVAFEEMLTSLRFRDHGAPAEAASPAVATPIDGVWTTSITRDQLAGSPLLLDAAEVNDENWGDMTFTFERGRFIFEQENPRGSYSAAGAVRVDGTTLRLDLENGERFAMRWSVDGDELTLARDEALGISPTPFVLTPWTRQR